MTTVTWWSVVRFVHVLSATGWVGGQLLLSGVVLPVLRSEVEQPARGRLIHTTAKRFGFIANIGLLPLLALTGVALARHRGVTVEALGEPGYGRLLSIKLGLVVLSIALAGVHGLLATKNPRGSRILGIAGMVSSVGIVLFATALVP